MRGERCMCAAAALCAVYSCVFETNELGWVDSLTERMPSLMEVFWAGVQWAKHL
jgi:hypothetical protein